MAKFRFSGTIRRVIVEHIEINEGVIEVTKKAVCNEFDLPNVVDGDPTHWIDEAQRAVEYGCDFKIVDSNGAQWDSQRRAGSPASLKVEALHIEEMEYDV